MQIQNIEDFVGGWFIGNFEPTLLSNKYFEISVKRFKQGDVEPIHYQLEAIEFTVIISGSCRIGNLVLGPNEILQVDPFEAVDFEALTDVVLVAVKTPSLPRDKALGVPNA